MCVCVCVDWDSYFNNMEKSGDPKQILNAYIYDFLVKSALHGSAQTFFEEAGLRQDGNGNDKDKVGDNDSGDFEKKIVSVDSSRSYLYEWWKIYWDLCAVRSSRDDSETTELPAVQAYYKLWSEKKAKEHAIMTQEVKAASLQQKFEDAGDYGDEKVDASKLALVVNSVPLKSNLRKAPSASLKRVKRQKHYKRKQVSMKEGLRCDQNLLMRSGEARTDRDAQVSTVSRRDSDMTSLVSQELPSFDLQSFEYDQDFPLFASSEMVPLPAEFPPIPGEDTSFIDNSGERAFNFLNGT